MNIDEFLEKFPYPDSVGVNKLYKFTTLNPIHPEYLSSLLVDAKLYHAQPSELNDPWECSPIAKAPTSTIGIRKFETHMRTVARQRGENKTEGKKKVKSMLKNKSKLNRLVQKSIIDTYSNLRICSLSSVRDHGLLWAHYANSHSGICLEFDASKPPFHFSNKVTYQSEYPELEYPPKNNASMHVPLLTKSDIWEYEKEFRIILSPYHQPYFPTLDNYSIIPTDALIGVYFGVNISDSDKELVLQLIDNGPFNPSIYAAELSTESFTLIFHEQV